MKTYQALFAVLAILLCISSEIYAQGRNWLDFGKVNPLVLSEARAALQKADVNVNPDDTRQLLDSLQSANSWVRNCVIRYCGYGRVRDALPIFKTLFLEHPWVRDLQRPYLSEREAILYAVTLMRDTLFHQEFRIEIDSLRNYPGKFNSLGYFAAYLVSIHNDDYGFSAVNRVYSSPDSIIALKPSLAFLASFADSRFHQEVINELRISARIHPNWYERSAALTYLEEMGDTEIEQLAYERSRSDESLAVRDHALIIVRKLNVSLYEQALVDALRTEPTEEGRQTVYSNLAVIGRLWSYKLLVDSYRTNRDPVNNWFIRADLENPYYLGREVNTSIVNAIDSIGTWVSQIFSFGWLGDQSFSDELNADLVKGKTLIISRDSIGGARAIKQFQASVDLEFQDSLNNNGRFVNLDAWRFLFYKARFILDRLPQIPVSPGCVVKLVHSTGIKLAGGSLQYYDGTWKDATNNNDGTFSITTSMKTLSLRMTYESGSQTKSNVTVGPDMVVFQTVNAQVKLQNSQGALMDTGSVQYYAGAWRSFGTTTSGIASKELLPGSYSFRMTYAGGSNDKQQDIGSNPVVVFQTVNASVQLKNSLGNLIDQGAVQYYAGSWRNFGLTTSGVVSKELLANNYSFRMTYAYGSKDQQQNIATNPVVVFQSVNATVQLKNSQGVLIDHGTVQYYAGAWRSFGTTSGGSVYKELLPINYSFRMTNEGVSNDKAQDLSTNSTVSFATVLCTVSVKNSQNQPVDNAIVSYYATTWRQIGPTVNGQVTKDLLPANLTFRMTLGAASQDKAQNIGTNSLVEFVVQ